ncbi:MAG TPA: BON domain-containing protein [Steroidobacteraceae bacterium]|nr:BON domain-containing protein [Steroidobacteraceae bacterium]
MESRPDTDIQRQVESELFACPDVDETDIAVKVIDGTVTLTGYARSFFDKYGAEDAVKRVRGVTAVANDIQVRPRFPAAVTDPEIARAAVTAIRRALPQCSEAIMPLVRDGVVTLEGVLDWNCERERAERVVRELRGVSTVINAIVLTLGARQWDTQ